MHILKGALTVLIVALVFALTGCGGEDQATKIPPAPTSLAKRAPSLIPP